MLIIGGGIGYGRSENQSKITSNTAMNMMMATSTKDVSAPMSMTDMMTTMNAGLSRKTGDAFDQAFH